MSGNLCEHCVGYCCRHIALPIEKPESREDFDDIRWYLLHTGVGVFVEDGEWYLQVDTDCRHLRPDYLCGIYETRPQICRNYGTDNCDYHSGDYGYEHHFLSAEHLDAHIEAKFGKKPKGQAKSATTKRKGPKVKLSRRPIDGVQFNESKKDRQGVDLPALGDTEA